MINRFLTACLITSLLALNSGLVLAESGSKSVQSPDNGDAGKPAADTSRKPRVPLFNVDGDLAGQLSVMTTEYEDTFAGIGNRVSLGYLELVKANPGVDPWLPGDGTTITLPRKYIMPDGPREGIVINLAEYRLYYFTDGGVEVYPVGVGTEDNPSPVTDAQVTMSLKSPAWYPPKSIRAEYEAMGEYLPRMIPPGPDNPLGNYALMLSAEGYLIHGTNKQFGVGMQVSHGCFRMYNEDIGWLAYEVSKGTPVRVIREPVKIGMRGNEVWLEVHRPEEIYTTEDREELWQSVSRKIDSLRERLPGLQVKRSAIESAVELADGLPRMVGEQPPQLAAESAAPGRSTPNGPGIPQQLWF